MQATFRWCTFPDLKVEHFPGSSAILLPIRRYEPIFKAITLDGREVWRRRVYRVRRAVTPGTFHLSVLDNGVTSKVGCCLHWC